jgi:LPXTG-site transpeptidase (sortase) family protein
MMRYVRRTFMLAALFLVACGAADRAAKPLDTHPAAQATITPKLRLAATSQALMDTPILEDRPGLPPTARPAALKQTPIAEPAPAAPLPVVSSKPERIVIPDIDMDQPVLQVGVDADTFPIVPKHDAGWYEGSAMPGQGDNIVLWGHALRFKDSPQIPAPFGQIQKLKLGAQIVLYTTEGRAYSYTVEQQIWATPDQVDYIRPKGIERLTLISCIGDKIMTKRGIDMTHRLVTIATPTPQDDANRNT